MKGYLRGIYDTLFPRRVAPDEIVVINEKCIMNRIYVRHAVC